MDNRAQERKHRIGEVPGTLIAPVDAHATVVEVMQYGPKHLEREQILDFDVARHAGGGVRWINVTGLADVGALKSLGRVFELHPLALEDALHLHQRPKAEPYDGHLYLVTQMVRGDDSVLETEQVSFFLVPGAVITVQERAGDCFDPVRLRIEQAHGRIRERGADYLLYALVDAVLDRYFPLMESYGERLDALETAALTPRGGGGLLELSGVRHDLVVLRRLISPMREALARLLRDDDDLITPDTRVYFRDCLDHASRLLDAVNSYWELATSLLDTHVSLSNQRLSEIMKFLAVVSTIFLPLNFIAALYGMNFQPDVSPFNMPELTWRFGYPFALALMLTAIVFLILLLWRRRWIGSDA